MKAFGWMLTAVLFVPATTGTLVSQEARCASEATVNPQAATCESKVDVNALLHRVRGEVTESSRNAVSATLADRYVRQDVCSEWFVMVEGTTPNVRTWDGEIPACVQAHDPQLECPTGEAPRPPLWVSSARSDGSYGPWTQASNYQCPEDPLPAAVAAAWRSMSISPSSVMVQPDNGWVIASMGVIASTTSDPQTSQVTVLGTPVTLRATPTRFTWTARDLDGTVTFEETMTEPGRTYEQGGEAFKFERREYRIRLTLTTMWEGHYSLNNGTSWLPAPGTATTTTEPTSIHVYNPRTRLVSNPNERGSHTVDAPTRTDPDNDGIDNYTIADEHIDAYLEARAKNRTWQQP